MMDTDKSYEVGYGKPPEATQWKPRQSGNPAGRPRGSRSRKTIAHEVANEVHTYRENGRKKKATAIELVLYTLRNLAVGGNVQAVKLFMAVEEKYSARAPEGVGGYLVAPAPMDPEDWIRREMELNQHRKRPGTE